MFYSCSSLETTIYATSFSDPDRLVFVDDGECAEVCSCYATRIVDGDWYWFLDMLQDESDDIAR